MRVLILGGTQFIGRHIAEALLSAGHVVTVLNRGQSPDELPDAIERLRGDRDRGLAGLSALSGRAWDACVDTCGFTPRQVRPSAELLRSAVGRYVYVSAVSVYGDPQERPVDETRPRQPPVGEDVTEVNQETYGALKVACEDLLQEQYGDRCTLLRPQVVVGPHDQSGRYAYWVHRAAQGDEMLAPGDGSDHVQVIDVRDVARFAVHVVERDLAGPFNLAGPRMTWTAFLKLLGATNLVWVAAETLQAAGVTEFELPLYRHERGPRSGLMDVSNERARRAGLVVSDPAATLRDVRAWMEGRNLPVDLTREREAELIRISRETM